MTELNCRDCSTVDEIKELIERLLLDKQRIEIKSRPKDYDYSRTDISWLVEWRTDKELCNYAPTKE